MSMKFNLNGISRSSASLVNPGRQGIAFSELNVSPDRDSSGTDCGDAPDEDDSIIGQEVKNKILSVWNNVKYGWSVVKVKAAINYEAEIWLLGECYLAEARRLRCSPRWETYRRAEIERYKHDVFSRIYFSYRRDFPRLAGSTLTSDCGWGCMLRTGQMVLAQGLLQHFVGRKWRWSGTQSDKADMIHRMVIRAFGDDPTLSVAPFSIHHFVALGHSSGKKAGDWFGPASVAHIIKSALAAAARESVLYEDICCYVASDCTIFIDDVIGLCTAPSQRRSSTLSHNSTLNGSSAYHHNQYPPTRRSFRSTPFSVSGPESTMGGSGTYQPYQTNSINRRSSAPLVSYQNGNSANGPRASSTFNLYDSSDIMSSPSANSSLKCTYQRQQHQQRLSISPHVMSLNGYNSHQHGNGSSQNFSMNRHADLAGSNHAEKWRSVIIMVPVRLGGDKMNPIYSDCVKNILKLPSCIGIIGGKPKHSLYFIGWQEDKLIYLDPHYCQDSVDVQANGFPLGSYHCPTAHRIAFTAIDPSCAFAFYLRTRPEFENFAATIRDHVVPRNQRADYPLFTVLRGTAEAHNDSISPQGQEWSEKTLQVIHSYIDSDGRVVESLEGDEFIIYS